MPRTPSSAGFSGENNIAQPSNKKGWIIFLLVMALLLLGSTGGFVWSYSKYKKAQKQIAQLITPEGQAEVAQKEIDALLAKVGALIILPTDEQPIVATIQNAEELAKSQAFYINAQNGDNVLIYQSNAKAIIYNPREDILVNVGPIYIEKNQNQPTENTGTVE